MSLLDDPALRLRAPAPPETDDVRRGVRVRFLPTSDWARRMMVPPCSAGEVLGRIREGAADVLFLMVDGVGYCTEVPRAEVERMK